MKKIISLLLALITLISMVSMSFSAFAETEYTSGMFKYIQSGPNVEITGFSNDKYKSQVMDLVIPAKLDGKDVLSVKGFSNCPGITSVTISEGVKSIKDYAFNGCNGLEKIIIPSTIEVFGSQPFGYCDYLSEIYYNAKDAADTGFNGNVVYGAGESVYNAKIVIGDQVTTIPARAFYNYVAKSVDVSFPSSLKTIRYDAFEYVKFKGDVILPEGLEYIGENAFRLGKINNLYIPSTVKQWDIGSVTCVNAYVLGKNTKSTIWSKFDELARNVNFYVLKGSVFENDIKDYMKNHYTNQTYNYIASNIPSFKISNRNTNSLALSWSRVNSKGYELQQYKNGNWVNIKTFASNASSYTVSSLSAGTQYRFRIRSYNIINGKKYYGDYKTLTAVTNPKGTTISKLTPKSKAIGVAWKKQASHTTGYQIQYSTSSKFTKNTTKTVAISKNNTTSKTISKLKGKKKYYVRVRTYKTIDGKNCYSAWSAKKAVTTKK